jgi:hypothetical protein
MSRYAEAALYDASHDVAGSAASVATFIKGMCIVWPADRCHHK